MQVVLEPPTVAESACRAPSKLGDLGFDFKLADTGPIEPAGMKYMALDSTSRAYGEDPSCFTDGSFILRGVLDCVRCSTILAQPRGAEHE